MISGQPDPVFLGCLLSSEELFTFVNPMEGIFHARKGWEFQLMDMRSRSDALAAVMFVFLPVLTISVGTLAALAVAIACLLITA
jgi:O-antigen ligase